MATAMMTEMAMTARLSAESVEDGLSLPVVSEEDEEVDRSAETEGLPATGTVSASPR